MLGQSFFHLVVLALAYMVGLLDLVTLAGSGRRPTTKSVKRSKGPIMPTRDKSKNIPTHFHVTADVARTVSIPSAAGEVLVRGSEVELTPAFIEANTDREGRCDVLERVLNPDDLHFVAGRCPEGVRPSETARDDLRVVPRKDLNKSDYAYTLPTTTVNYSAR